MLHASNIFWTSKHEDACGRLLFAESDDVCAADEALVMSAVQIAVERIARSYQGKVSAETLDDAKSKCVEHIYKLLRRKKFDPKRGKFFSFMTRSIYNEMKRLLFGKQRIHNTQRSVSLETPTTEHVTLGETLADQRANACDAAVEAEERAEIFQLLTARLELYLSASNKEQEYRQLLQQMCLALERYFELEPADRYLSIVGMKTAEYRLTSKNHPVFTQFGVDYHKWKTFIYRVKRWEQTHG